MNEKDRQVLLRVKGQVRLVRELSEKLTEMQAATLSAVQLDGMPHGRGGLARGLEVKLMMKESLEKSLEREGAILHELEDEARGIISGLKIGLYSFCMYYYIGGLSLEDTIRMTDRSRRQIMRYKRENRGEEGERGRWDGWHLKGTGMTPKWHPNVILRFKRGMI